MIYRLTAMTLALAASSAWAITPAPAPAPVAEPAPVAAPITSTSNAGAAAGAVSGSTSMGGAGGSSSAAGGNAAGGNATGSSTSATHNSTQSRALGLGLPSINFGSASTSECLVGGPDGSAIGWSFWADTKPGAIEAPICSLRALAREAAAQCQWRTAAVLRGEAFRKLTGSEPPPISDTLRDVSPSECMQQPVAPAPVVVPAPAPVSVVVMTDVEQAAPVVAPRRPPKGKPVRCEKRVVEVCEPVQEAKR